LNVPEHVLFFDGECNFCDSAVNFFIDHDHAQVLKFASLQSDAARELLAAHGAEERATDINTMVLLTGGKVYTKSSAALRVGRFLGFPYNLGLVFLVVPAFVRDFFYEIIARNRYKWFGKREECRVPTKELRSRFL
jgi:predicted DCC family thiol-disulfide oxidoreductase YuxK